MGCECLTPELIKKFHHMAKYGYNEVSVCLSNGCVLKNETTGDVASVDRAGTHPSCSCVVHIHPQPPELKHKLPYSCIPSPSDVSVVIFDALMLHKNGFDKDKIASYEDAVFYPCGFIRYSVFDINRLIDFMISKSLTIHTIHDYLSSAFNRIKQSCRNLPPESHVQCVKAKWILLCHEIGVKMIETILD